MNRSVINPQDASVPRVSWQADEQTSWSGPFLGIEALLRISAFVVASLQGHKTEDSGKAEAEANGTSTGGDDGSLGDVLALGGLFGLGSLRSLGSGRVLGSSWVLRSRSLRLAGLLDLRVLRLFRVARVDGMLRLQGVTRLLRMSGLGVDGVVRLSTTGLVGDPSRTGRVSLSDGARAVSDSQSGGLSDDVVLAAQVEAGRLRAVGGVNFVHVGDCHSAVFATSMRSGNRSRSDDVGGLSSSDANEGKESSGVEGVHLE
jgi:hypothetical protein